jgi:glycine/D-amino acid oxidase-like deaminating enzyme
LASLANPNLPDLNLARVSGKGNMKTDIVIVGAGLAGASTAFHLRRLGVRDVALLEKEAAPGEHASGRNAAMVRRPVTDSEIARLNTEGADALSAGELCEFRPTGGMLIGWDGGEADAAGHCPLAAGRGRWCPEDGVVDPAGLLHTYLRGQKVLCETELLEWRGKDRGGGVAVRTNRGTITARLLVNAAGAWAGAVGDLPLRPLNRHLFLTPPMKNIDPSWPFVWDVVQGVYFRPDSGGLLLCVCDEERREPGDYRIDYAVRDKLAETLARSQPALGDVAIKMCWTGQRTFAADRRFTIGFDPRHAGLFHVAGLGGHGVTASYAIGRMAAEMLVAGGQTSGDPFDPGRLLAVPEHVMGAKTRVPERVAGNPARPPNS